MRKLLIIIFVSVTGMLMAQTQETTTTVTTTVAKPRSYFGVALGVSASTNGVGVNVTTALNKFLALRLSYEKLDNSIIQNVYAINNPINISLSGQSLAMTPTIKTGGLSAILDLYLGKSFYISGGVVNTAMDMSAILKSASPLKIGDITFTPDDLGQLGLTIKPEQKLSPYGAFGFGRNISRDHRLCMSLEFGAYYMKSYVIGLTGTNMFSPTAEANQAVVDQLNSTLKTFSWSGIYPVIKLGISYKIFGETKK